VNLICMNADALPEFGEQAGPSFFANRYSIGLWFWEVTAAPVGAWDPAFALLDEVWAPTRHVAEAVRSVSPIRVEQITLPIEMGPPAPVPRSALGLPEGHMFLFSFDYLSVFARKNPLAVVEAYRRAFPEPDEAVLVIKSINHEHDPDGHARLREAALGRSDIVLIDRYLDPALKDGLMAACDSYVSLHRSEGFGLTMAEAMYLGKPVIATGYSGNLDFMTDDNSYLVDFDLVGIGAGAAPYPPDGSWAQPRVEHAALLMREVYDDPEAARARGDEAARSVRETHSARVAGERMLERLEAVRGEAVRRPPAGAIAPELPGTVARGPIAPSHSAAGPVGPALRKAVLRVMKPFSSFQMTVNDQLVRSVSGLERELRRVGDAQQHAEAAQLATARRLHREIDDLRHDEAQVAGRLGVIEYEQSAVPHMEGDPFTLFADPVAGRVQGYDAPDAPDASDGDGYRSFEDIFRGSEEFIRSRQERFLALIGDREPVLDVGCGRGELLDLLRDRSIAYVGVDSDPDMVARCHEKGHDGVLLADGVQYLAAVEPGSLGVVFAAQLIEHLPYEALERFFALSRQALAPDGLLIAETVNPHSVPALRTFWVDLTHQHPIFPEVALAMSRSAGFEHAFVFHPNGTGDVEADRHRTGEYALVASPVSTERERTA
jgi:glycosyltransferase involved in cell wall biosynthesis/SAM-dependent methyltransferase